MDPTTKKTDRRIAKLEQSIRDLIPLAEMGASQWQEPRKEIERAKKLITPASQKDKMNSSITLKDTDLLNRFPVGKWFAAGAYSVHGAKVARLYRLGLLERRIPSDPKLARTWDYYRPR